MSCNDFMKALSIQEIVYRVVLYIVLTISLKVVTSSRFHILKLNATSITLIIVQYNTLLYFIIARFIFFDYR
jgi:hypothetical protein